MPHAALIRAATQTLIDHVEELTELDQAIGDGDHGLNMKRGALAIQTRLPEWQGQPLNDTLKAMGMSCMSVIGGSSGPVFGTLLVKLASADDIAAELTGAILKDLSMPRGQQAILLVNGFGATPLHELYLMVHAVLKVLQGAGVMVVRHLTGSYVTSLEMAGCSVTVTAVDAGMLALWDMPVYTATLRWGM